MSKITVSEWIEYLSDSWPRGQWVDDSWVIVGKTPVSADESVNDMNSKTYANFKETEIVHIESGIILREGETKGVSLKSTFLAWRKVKKAKAAP